jgi:negative regulator of sigma E activity
MSETNNGSEKIMDCNWTEKISQLVDGELSADETRAVERHAADCFACRLAREDFMLLRHQLISYRTEANPLDERRALRKILGDASDARGTSVGWRERVASVFATPRLSPALTAVAALFLVAVVVGLVMLRGTKNTEVARGSKPVDERSRNTNVRVESAPAPTETANVARDDEPKRVETASKDRATNNEDRSGGTARIVRVKNAQSVKSRRAPLLGVNGSAGETAMGTPKDVRRLKLPLTPMIAVDPTELIESQLASLSTKVETTDSGTSRHVEQAQVLLRSFRNARAGGDDPATTEIAREKRRSKELLYRNILLRREAASRGNVEVESLLSNLEPILIDIANLPDKPAQDEVRSITERMRKKNIVAMLQVADASHIY